MYAPWGAAPQPISLGSKTGRETPANWAVLITVVTQLLEDCGEALSRPRLLRDTLIVLRHTAEALNPVFQF